jgi:hypothetical protein
MARMKTKRRFFIILLLSGLVIVSYMFQIRVYEISTSPEGHRDRRHGFNQTVYERKGYGNEGHKVSVNERKKEANNENGEWNGDVNEWYENVNERKGSVDEVNKVANEGNGRKSGQKDPVDGLKYQLNMEGSIVEKSQISRNLPELRQNSKFDMDTKKERNIVTKKEMKKEEFHDHKFNNYSCYNNTRKAVNELLLCGELDINPDIVFFTSTYYSNSPT